MNPCHSQKNLYRAHPKIWDILGRTEGEERCGRVRFAREKPPGDKLNAGHLSRQAAIYVAARVPGGGVIHATSSESFDVYSEQRLTRYREILQQVKAAHV